MSESELMLAEIADLHRPVQWRGWRLWAARIGREPLAYVDHWCAECRRPWPCRTRNVMTAAHLAAQRPTPAPTKES